MFRSRIFGKTAVTEKDYKDCYRDNKTNPQWMYGLEPTETSLIQVGGQEVGRIGSRYPRLLTFDCNNLRVHSTLCPTAMRSSKGSQL